MGRLKEQINYMIVTLHTARTRSALKSLVVLEVRARHAERNGGKVFPSSQISSNPDRVRCFTRMTDTDPVFGSTDF